MPKQGWQLSCPVSVDASTERISLAHGEGGRLMRKLIEQVIQPHLNTIDTPPFGDAFHLQVESNRLAFSTDSYVVSPLFFPGGDIGSLAVYGTVNDLAVSGAIPRWLSLSLIMEEGLPLAVLEHVLLSIAKASQTCRVMVVTGDTKVVPRGAADGLFLNTSGVGDLVDPVPPGPAALQEGDVLIVSGAIGRHGIAVLAAREQFDFHPPPESDCGSLLDAVASLRQAIGQSIRAMRDTTRGGVTAVLHEWAAACGMTLHLEEERLPLNSQVRSVCELLGLEALHVACEGTMMVAVASEAADRALAALRQVPQTKEAAIVGTVRRRMVAPVTIRRVMGPDQSLDEPSGAPLPRIC